MTQCMWCKRVYKEETKTWEVSPVIEKGKYQNCPDCEEKIKVNVKERAKDKGRFDKSKKIFNG